MWKCRLTVWAGRWEDRDKRIVLALAGVVLVPAYTAVSGSKDDGHPARAKGHVAVADLLGVLKSVVGLVVAIRRGHDKWRVVKTLEECGRVDERLDEIIATNGEECRVDACSNTDGVIDIEARFNPTSSCQETDRACGRATSYPASSAPCGSLPLLTETKVNVVLEFTFGRSRLRNWARSL
jgi:hypothetical protein